MGPSYLHYNYFNFVKHNTYREVHNKDMCISLNYSQTNTLYNHLPNQKTEHCQQDENLASSPFPTLNPPSLFLKDTIVLVSHTCRTLCLFSITFISSVNKLCQNNLFCSVFLNASNYQENLMASKFHIISQITFPF